MRPKPFFITNRQLSQPALHNSEVTDSRTKVRRSFPVGGSVLPENNTLVNPLDCVDFTRGVGKYQLEGSINMYIYKKTP